MKKNRKKSSRAGFPVRPAVKSLAWRSIPCLLLAAGTAAAQQAQMTNAVIQEDYLFFNNGQQAGVVVVEDAAPGLKSAMVPEDQKPKRKKGVATPADILAKSGKPAAAPGWEFFPSQSLTLAPYLDSFWSMGNTCMQPGALIHDDPLSDGAQLAKTKLSEVGLDYNLSQAYTYTALKNSANGPTSFNAYNMSWVGIWNLVRTPAGQGVMLNYELDAGSGMGFNQNKQQPQSSLGSLNDPSSNYQGQGIYLANLSLAATLCNGTVIVQGGQIDMGNYFDANSYANNNFGQFMNVAFVNSGVYALTTGSLGGSIAWQPCDVFYLMTGVAANNTPAMQSPFSNVSGNNVSYLLEAGFPFADVLGLGPGTYRVQPFLATADGTTAGGLCFNLQQQLGKESPFGWFGRFGFGNPSVVGVNGIGAKAEAATGFVVQSPFTSHGYFSAANNEFLGIGFVWSQPSNLQQPVNNQNEYGVELTYVTQLTPTVTLQPDLQFITDPVDGNQGSTSTVFQLQLNVVW